ncbi:hypothetical protein GCM10011581_34290 [Saccharopolyspora subtropica]|uniref:Cell division protein SepF n=1 Tax=Saccharopolyspora thermophila TaxID=89367 RepID=A0A917K096_9PSEU|nr:cell division protein SepF [Saccharopolyspora subtropica]GGI94304.1 hypothetical protein GCM10011581_34290 [Saccharopolyspora subtropica]
MVKTLHPREYADVYHVGDYYRQGNAVVMDLTGMSSAEATQIVDFAAGLVVGRGGDMDRIAPRVFLLLPPGMRRQDVRSDARR